MLRAFADEERVEARFGERLRFAADGRVEEHREYWSLEEGRREPAARLGPVTSLGDIELASIADHPHLVEAIGRAHFELWGHADPGGTVESWTGSLRRRVTPDRIPTIYVALAGEELLGSASLVEHDMDVHRELAPWLSGVFVAPAHRGRGIGTALVRHVVAKAAEIGVERLYLYTESARGFYERLGWRHLFDDHYEGEPVVIMAIDPTR